ncbi:MAG: MotA/TolQ/ExbB proton channel family protein [Planctomycetota bacterium]
MRRLLTMLRTVFVAGALVLVAWVMAVFPNAAARAQSDTGTSDAFALDTPARAGAVVTSNETSLAEAFFIQRHPVSGRVEWLGSMIIWFLLGLSAFSIGLICALALGNTLDKILPQQQVDTVRELLRQRQLKRLIEASERYDSMFGRVMHTALGESAHGHGAMIRALEQTSEHLTVERLRRVEILNVIGNVAPMIGLFGTVYGMILAFRQIVASGGSPDPVELAAGIGTALTTTFWGLVVAIPALAGYAVLRNRIDSMTVEATRTAEEIINRFRPDTPSKDA